MGSGSSASCLHVSALSLSLSFPWGARGLAQIGSQGAHACSPPPIRHPSTGCLGPCLPFHVSYHPPSLPIPPGSLPFVFKLLRAPCCHCSVPAPRAWLKEGAPSQGCGSLFRQGLGWPPWTTGVPGRGKGPAIPACSPCSPAAGPGLRTRRCAGLPRRLRSSASLAPEK